MSVRPTTEIYIITGSTGHSKLCDAVVSVDNLIVPEGVRLIHWVVVDGPQYAEATKKALEGVHRAEGANRSVITLPINTGGSGYLCHKILAACFNLIPDNAWVCCLDEDNAYERHHIVELMRSMEHMHPPPRWAYTMRTVFDDDEEMIDTVESIGLVKPTCIGQSDRLIDTNCYMFHASLAKQLAPVFGTTKARPQDGQIEADRAVCQTLAKHEPRCGFTRVPTVRYRLANRVGPSASVSMDFFKSASAAREWDPQKKDVYVFHFNNVRTYQALRNKTCDSWLREWCLTLFDGLHSDYNVLDGFECLGSGLPHDATCLMTMCDPSHLPLGALRDMKLGTHKDMKRILYTTKGPTYAHRHQWNKPFLESSCDVLLTYCDFALEPGSSYTPIFMPHNAKFLPIAGMLRNKGTNDGSVAMVIECRDGSQSYNLNGFDVSLSCQDWMRQAVAKSLGPRLVVVGHGWKEFIEGLPDDEKPRLLYEPPPGGRVDKTSDTYSTVDFGMVIENCDAVGYVSEKIQDVIVGGAIPIVHLPWLLDVENLHDDDLRQWAAGLAKGDGVWFVNAARATDPSTVNAWLEEQGYFDPSRIAEMKKAVRDVRLESLEVCKFAEIVTKAIM